MPNCRRSLRALSKVSMASLQAIKRSRPRQVWEALLFSFVSHHCRIRPLWRVQLVYCTVALPLGLSEIRCLIEGKIELARACEVEKSFPPPARSHTGPVPSERFESARQASTAGRRQQEEERGVVCDSYSLGSRAGPNNVNERCENRPTTFVKHVMTTAEC